MSKTTYLHYLHLLKKATLDPWTAKTSPKTPTIEENEDSSCLIDKKRCNHMHLYKCLNAR